MKNSWKKSDLRKTVWACDFQKILQKAYEKLRTEFAKLTINLRRHYRNLTKTWNSRQVMSFGKPS